MQSYQLHILLKESTKIQIGKLGSFNFSKGKYIYTGSAKKNIEARINRHKSTWSQYAFQFAHEVCHIVCRYREEKNPNKWFEESLCEMASLFALRGMSKTWKTKAPYPNWKNYGPKLYKYAQERIDASPIPNGSTLPKWYQRNEVELRKNATIRKLNNIAAVALLPLFEKQPAHWPAVGYINKGKFSSDETFDAYLKRWHTNVPKKHKAFVIEIAAKFNVEIE